MTTTSESPWLLVSTYYPPRVSGAGTVYRNLLRHFDRGVIHVVATSVPEDKAESTAPPGRVHWIPSWPRWLRGQRYLDILLVPLVALACVWVVIRHRPRAIVATVPEVPFAAGAWLAHLVTRRTLHLYLHDTILEAQVRSTNRWLARVLQPRLFRSATTVFVLSEALEQLYRTKYGVESIVVPHVVDEDLLHRANLERARTPGKRPVVGFTGAVYGLNADSLRRMASAIGRVDDAHLVISSPGGAEDLVSGPRVEHRFFAERDDLLRFQRDCDVLFVPLAFEYEGGEDEIVTVFPTKLLEYLVSGTPILVHAPARCYLTRFALREGIALVVDDPSVEALSHALQRLLSDEELRFGLVERATALAVRYRGDEIATRMKEKLFAR